LHGTEINVAAKKSRLKRIFYKWAYKNTFVICLSEFLVNDITDIYEGRPLIVNNGIKPIARCLETDKKIKAGEGSIPVALNRNKGGL